MKRLNKKVIHELADYLVTHQKLYDQDTLGTREYCGTVCCLAGCLYRREIGSRKYVLWVKKLSQDRRWPDPEVIVSSASRQLGLKANYPEYAWTAVYFPQIFQTIGHWPMDLYLEYMDRILKPRGRVIVALKALQRLRQDGTIDEPAAVHTRLPQLKALLGKAA